MDPLTPRRQTKVPDTDVECWMTPITLAELERYGKQNGEAPKGFDALTPFLVPHFWADEGCVTALLTAERVGALSKRQVEAMSRELFEFSGLTLGGGVPADAEFRNPDGTVAGAELVPAGESVRVPTE